jgi:hypothetical protein
MIHEKKKEKNPRGRRSNGRAITLNEGRRKKNDSRRGRRKGIYA